MDKSHLITIVVTAAATAAITVVVSTLTGWLVTLTRVLPKNEKTVRLVKRAFTKVNILIVVSVFGFAWDIYDLHYHLSETGPVTRSNVLHLILATAGIFLWFLALIGSVTVAILKYRDQRNP